MCVREREFLVYIPPVCVMYEQNKKRETKGAVLQVKGGVVPLLRCERSAILLGIVSDVASNTHVFPV